MELATVILMLLGVIVLVFVGGGIVAYSVFAVPAMKSAPPLAEEDRAVCGRQVRMWKAYPFLCQAMVKKRGMPLPAMPQAKRGKGEAGP